MLPRMIQMGICDSSGLEISNVTCKERVVKNAAAAGCKSWVGRGWGGSVMLGMPELPGRMPTPCTSHLAEVFPVVPGLEHPGSIHNRTELLGALQTWVPGVGCSSPSVAAGFFPLGSEQPRLLAPCATILPGDLPGGWGPPHGR